MKKSIILVLLSAFMFASCGETFENGPIDGGDNAPKMVTNIEWEAVAGGAIISYEIPKDPSLYYVEASYVTKNGTVRCNKASVFTNKIQVDGMAEVTEHKVSIVTVGRNGKRSEPKSVVVVPLDPPIKYVFDNLSVVPAHQGLEVFFKNESKADMAIGIVERLEDGSVTPIDMFYTSSESGSFKVRNQTFVKHEYGVYLRDKYQNYSDTLYTHLTPIYDVEVDKKKFAAYDLPTTANSQLEIKMSQVWDGNKSSGGRTLSIGFPMDFCFTMGQKVKLTRFNSTYARNTSALQGTWAGAHPKRYEIYGSNEPAADGSWESWTLLGEFQSVKPSGLPLGSCTEEDYVRASVDGEDFVFPEGLDAYEYIRIKILSVWGYAQYVFLYEWTLYGDDGNGPKPEEPGEGEGTEPGTGEGE